MAHLWLLLAFRILKQIRSIKMKTPSNDRNVMQVGNDINKYI